MSEPKTINALIRAIAAGERIEDHMAMIEREAKWILRFEIADESAEETEAYRELYAVAKSLTKPSPRLVEQDLTDLYAARDHTEY